MIFVTLLVLVITAKWTVVAENERADIQDGNIWNSTKTKVAVAGGLISTVLGITLMTVFWHRWRKKVRTPLHIDYPAYGITGPSKLNAMDSKLAQGAQMFQYEHKKRLFTQGKGGDQDKSADSEEEEELENNYSVFECPGLAETGEMEVQNPMFVESKETK